MFQEFFLPLHKIGYASAIQNKLYCVQLALSLHKIGYASYVLMHMVWLSF